MTKVFVAETTRINGSEKTSKTFDILLHDRTAYPPQTRTVASCASQADADKLARLWNSEGEAAIQLAYLVAGADSAVNLVPTDRQQDHAIQSSGGHIGMVADLLVFAEQVADYFDSALESGSHGQGVFQYEVTVELGKFLAENWGSADTQKLFTAKLQELGANFQL